MIGSAPGLQAQLAQQRAAQNRTDDIAQQASGPNQEQVIAEKAEEFEAVFLGKMLKPMFEDLNTDGMFGGGHGEKMFRGMLVEEYAQEMAEKTDFGLTSEIKNELMKAQEVG
ncbi:rod-binding protein [Limimonas halophila]|nr:rod-binding protein [Limimonas halophila]